MEPLAAIGLFVGIPVTLAIIVTVAIMVPQRYGKSDSASVDEPAGLISSSPSAPNPAALPSVHGARVEATGGAHGSW